jgi:hypothetical protein
MFHLGPKCVRLVRFIYNSFRVQMDDPEAQVTRYHHRSTIGLREIIIIDGKKR